MKRTIVFFFTLAMFWAGLAWAQQTQTYAERVKLCQDKCTTEKATNLKACVNQCLENMLKEDGPPKTTKHKKKKKDSET